jgi:hypothetical protein
MYEKKFYQASCIGLELKPVKLGKNIELRYIPFSELAIPWNVCVVADEPQHDGHDTVHSRVSAHGEMGAKGSKASRTLKPDELDALKHSIGQFGLLKPFEVAEMPERLDFFYGKGKYVVIDGQRRYFAIRELLRLPTEHDKKKERDSLLTDSGHDRIVQRELQAQRQFDRLNIPDYVLVPCLVYPYTTLLQMVRHSIEDKKFSVKPSKDDLQLAEKMRAQGVQDLNPDELSELWETRSRINEEKKAIEKTLQQIRNRMRENRTQGAEFENKQDALAT